ncbi:hypothetical protein BAE44_0008124, partial [Dichanthelium oligosanthes]
LHCDAGGRRNELTVRHSQIWRAQANTFSVTGKIYAKTTLSIWILCPLAVLFIGKHVNLLRKA